MAPAPRVGEAFSPLDEQLGLLAGGLTPRAEETLVRLATWMPYAQAQELLVFPGGHPGEQGDSAARHAGHRAGRSRAR
jgi:hypothetical protein